MKRRFQFLFLGILCVAVSHLSAHVSFAYDGTGIWSYIEHTPWNNCGETFYPDPGEVGILQTGSSFIIVNDDFSSQGTVSGATYSFTESFCEDGGTSSTSNVITLSSETTATGLVSWVWSGYGQTCSGGHQLSLTKQAQAAPVYDATGKWTFSQSGFSSNCGSATTPRSSGFFQVTQTGNLVTAVDDLSDQHGGFVDGNTYSVLRSYLDDGGRTTEWVIITMNSESEGVGTGRFVWDDNCSECSGTWTISVTKEIPDHTITASAGPGGTIEPSGDVLVADGESQTFWFTPDSGYRVVSVLFDTEIIDAKGWEGGTVNDVVDDHTFRVLFEKIPYNPGVSLLLLKEE